MTISLLRLPAFRSHRLTPSLSDGVKFDENRRFGNSGVEWTETGWVSWHSNLLGHVWDRRLSTAVKQFQFFGQSRSLAGGGKGMIKAGDVRA